MGGESGFGVSAGNDRDVEAVGGEKVFEDGGADIASGPDYGDIFQVVVSVSLMVLVMVATYCVVS